MSDTPDLVGRGYALGPDDGEGLWHLGGLLTLKATGARTEGRFALMEERGGAGYASPLHVHEREDEALYVLEGTVLAYVGEEAFRATPGTYVYLPQRVPHAVVVEGDGARFLTLICPAGLERFFRETGRPAAARSLPPADLPVDEEALDRFAAQHGATILGPPPSPERSA